MPELQTRHPRDEAPAVPITGSEEDARLLLKRLGAILGAVDSEKAELRGKYLVERQYAEYCLSATPPLEVPPSVQAAVESYSAEGGQLYGIRERVIATAQNFVTMFPRFQEYATMEMGVPIAPVQDALSA